MTEETNQGFGRRKIKNLLLAPKAQFRTAISIFGIGFCAISILFGLMLYRLNDIMRVLVSISTDPEQAAGITANMPAVLWSTYAFLILSFLFSAGFLALTLTHQYLGPMVPIQRQIKKLIDGDYTGEVRLRNGDQFQEVANEVNRLTEVLRTKT